MVGRTDALMHAQMKKTIAICPLSKVEKLETHWGKVKYDRYYQ